VVIDSSRETPEESARKVWSKLEELGLISLNGKPAAR